MERWQDTLVVTVSSKSKRLIEAGTFALNWILSMQLYELIKEGCSFNIAAPNFQEFVEFCQETIKLNKGKESAELVINAEGTICGGQISLVMTENELSGRLLLKLKTGGNGSWLVLEEDELMLLAGCTTQSTGIVLNERLQVRQQASAAPQQHYVPVTQPITPPPQQTQPSVDMTQRRMSSVFSLSPSMTFVSAPSTPEAHRPSSVQQPPQMQGKVFMHSIK